MAGENGAARVKNYSVPMAGGLSYNFAAKAVDDAVLEALAALAEEAQLTEKFAALYNGEVINTGEKRRVLHQLTRGQLGDAVVVDGADKRAFYLEQQGQTPDGVHPVVHYLTEGAFEGVSPAADFNELSYLIENPAAAEQPISSLEHWVLSRTPKPEPTPSGARMSGDAGLFEQLRNAGRARDPGARQSSAGASSGPGRCRPLTPRAGRRFRCGACPP
jgi:hypothetical protein